MLTQIVQNTYNFNKNTQNNIEKNNPQKQVNKSNYGSNNHQIPSILRVL